MLYEDVFHTNSADWMQRLEAEIVFPTEHPIIVHGVNVREPQDVQIFGLCKDTAPVVYAHLHRPVFSFTSVLNEITATLQPIVWDA